MPIKIVLNGYFRSGTTFLWKYLKDSLPDHICFYEPLHPQLKQLMEKERTSNAESCLHGEYLWQEYLALDEDDLNRILSNHPNTESPGIKDAASLKRYLDVFHSLPGNILLQPNRLHFFIDLLLTGYNAKVIHVIRHPLDVLLAIEEASLMSPSRVKHILKELLKIFVVPRHFEVHRDYAWITGHSIYRPPARTLDFFSKFLVVWTVSNYYALKQIEVNGGFLLIYEEMCGDPEKARRQLDEYLGTSLKTAPPIKKGTVYEFRQKTLEKMQKAISACNIEAQFNHIIGKLKHRGIDYPI